MTLRPDAHTKIYRVVFYSVFFCLGLPPVTSAMASGGDAQKGTLEGKTSTGSPALREEADVLRARYRKAASRFHRFSTPGVPPSPSSSLRELYVALAGLQLAKLHDDTSSDNPQADQRKECVRRAKALLDTEEPDSIPQGRQFGRFVELAYLSRNDQSPQPYFVYIPDAYEESDDDYPLILGLHGWVPSTSITRPSLLPAFAAEVAEKENALLVLPYGRRNTDYKYVGEVDVIRVMREVQKFFRVDPERVYLTGVSMGGAGAWQIAAHYPDLFAGAAPVNGQTDWFEFWHRFFQFPTRGDLTQHLRLLFQANNPVDLAPNFANLYTYTQQAANGFIGAEHLDQMSKELKAVEAPHEMRIVNSPLRHYMYQEKSCWQKAFRKLLGQKRNRAPRRVRYKTFTPRYNGAYWIGGIRPQEWGKAATVDARRTDSGRFVVDTENVGHLKIIPRKRWSAVDKYHIEWNSRRITTSAEDVEKQGALVLAAPDEKKRSSGDEHTLAKTHKLCGPIPDAFRSAFVAVTGTTGSTAANKRNKRLAEGFARDWYRYAEGRVDILKDTEVTQATMNRRNLILFGRPGTNAVTGRIADRLPFKIDDQKIELPDGRSFDNQRLGLIMVYPNPLAPDHYVVIYQGVRWGEGCSRNHVFDRLPDFTIFKPESLEHAGINAYHAAGFFDEAWEYDPQLTDFGGTLTGENKQ